MSNTNPYFAAAYFVGGRGAPPTSDVNVASGVPHSIAAIIVSRIVVIILFLL
jgi:hypothetical protein